MGKGVSDADCYVLDPGSNPGKVIVVSEAAVGERESMGCVGVTCGVMENIAFPPAKSGFVPQTESDKGLQNHRMGFADFGLTFSRKLVTGSSRFPLKTPLGFFGAEKGKFFPTKSRCEA
ncbi:hypothetical protein TNCV_1345721 [Trichonephila clavipes]|nr:hypothetical protein TNCV_1345721 [Trichonephila clavipes]